MKVDKVINNNLVRSHNSEGIEIIVMGCGLGFKKKSGDIIDDALVEKVYRVDDKRTSNQLVELLSSIPAEHIKIADDIVSYAKTYLKRKINNSIFISLTDHISYAIERASTGINLRNALLWEVKKYYHDEYMVGMYAIDLIKERLGVTLTEDEAGYIAIHLAGAVMEEPDTGKTVSMVKMIQNILQIVKYHFNKELDENSVHYERFLTHLKFFAQRVVMNKTIENDDEAFINIIKNQYPEEFRCAKKIASYVDKEFGKKLTDEEMIYLAVHIKRVTMV